MAAVIIKEEPETGLPFALVRVVHYHQCAGAHPVNHVVEAGISRVELVTGGRGWVRAGDSWEEVGPGDLLWHQAGDVTIGRSDFDDPYRCLSVRFQGDSRFFEDLPRFSRWFELDEIRRFTREVVALFVDDRFDNQRLGEYIFARLAFQARLYRHQRRDDTLPEPLRLVLALIEDRYAEALNLGLLAAQAHWSVSHLHSVFRRYLHQSPHQYLIARRVRAAKECLGATDWPIKQIASDCGFGTAASFCSVFRQCTGCSPAAYRRDLLRQG